MAHRHSARLPRRALTPRYQLGYYLVRAGVSVFAVSRVLDRLEYLLHKAGYELYLVKKK